MSNLSVHDLDSDPFLPGVLNADLKEPSLSINVERGNSPFCITVPYCHRPFSFLDEPNPPGYIEPRIFLWILRILDVGTVNAK